MGSTEEREMLESAANRQDRMELDRLAADLNRRPELPPFIVLGQQQEMQRLEGSRDASPLRQETREKRKTRDDSVQGSPTPSVVSVSPTTKRKKR